MVRLALRTGRGVRRDSSFASPSARLPQDVYNGARCQVSNAVNDGLRAQGETRKKGSTYHSKSKEGIELDEAVEVAKDDRDREKLDVARVAHEQSHQLDHLGEAKHEDELCPERILSACELPVSGGPPARGEQEWIDDES